ncbi:AI-2E family transporter [Salinispira pacifica]|uniref:Transport protein n=1 Tax=Salinispira pacifica TaxID=1307761 RepID=V5WIG0_9SPIO|nr:AI-2E family transporter [Salinispira pacifica]AHC15354.1 transport protein [Salinispira pacifica]
MEKLSPKFMRSVLALLGVIVTFLIMGFLKLAGPVLIPFVVAFLLSFVLNPLVEVLVKIKIPRIIAVIMVIIVLVGLSFLIGLILYESIQSILRNFGKYQDRYTEVTGFIASTLNLPGDYFQTLEISGTIFSIVGQVSGNLVNFLGNTMLVLIFMLFLFLEKPFIRRKLVDAVRHEETERIARIFADITHQVGRYLMVKFIVSLLTSIIVFFGFTAIGVDFAFVWAVLTFLFNFIPTIGSISISAITSVFAIIQFFPQYEPIILAILAMVIPQIIIGNIIDPKMLGDSLNLSPVIILVAMLIWGYLWGIAGLFLAVPLTVGLKIVFEHVPSMRYISILMGTGTFGERKARLKANRMKAAERRRARKAAGDQNDNGNGPGSYIASANQDTSNRNSADQTSGDA